MFVFSLMVLVAGAASTAGQTCDTVSGPSGTITSPNYPGQYPNDADVCYILTPGAGQQVSIQFTDFSLEPHLQCGYDYVEIFDGGSSRGKSCGTSSPGRFSSNNEIRIVFSSDYSVTESGFSLDYEITEGGGSVGTTTTSPQGQGSCGVPDITPLNAARIVGGQTARAHSWPWQAALQSSSGYHVCGASLINENWVVTAHHCNPVPNYHTIVLGEHDTTSDSEAIQRIELEAAICHEGFNSRTQYNNDICLVKLTTPAVLGPHVTPVCLPETTDEYTPDMTCYTTGWGRTSTASSQPAPILQQTQLPLMDNAQCATHWSSTALTDHMICAGAEGSISCHGDSGGPLVCQKVAGGPWNVVGVVSWGSNDCLTTKPAVYARVTALRTWIDETISSYTGP